MSRHIVLYTPFAPTLGGGATILRSLIPHLEGFRIDWLYSSPRDEKVAAATWVGPPLTGGSAWHDISRTLALWSGVEIQAMQAVVAALRARRADGYWVIGHNEGGLVARALARQGERVHLTIHDDVPDGILGRSVRYRPLSGLARLQYASAMRSVRSLDFITERMRLRYRRTAGVDGVVVRPYLPSLSAPRPPQRPSAELLVGHIGTIYSVPEWRAFLLALASVARARGLSARMLMIGLDKFHAVAQEFPSLVEILPDTPEDQALELLAASRFCYAMYPFDPRAEVFRQTSLPTKLSTYLRARRPVLAHAPAGTSLADIVQKYLIGRVCVESSPTGIESSIAGILDASIPDGSFDCARAEVYGRHNVERMSTCLADLAVGARAGVRARV